MQCWSTSNCFKPLWQGKPIGLDDKKMNLKKQTCEQEQQKQKLLKMQKPTALAIKEQVSAEVDELMRKANEESTLRSTSKNKSKSSKRTPDLAQLISKSTRDATRHTTEEKTSFPEEEEEGEESGVTKRNYLTKNNFWSHLMYTPKRVFFFKSLFSYTQS